MIHYVVGNALDGVGIIAHVCNDIGAWGRGFTAGISARWPQPEAEYRVMRCKNLGSVQFVSVGPSVVVANMIAQHGIGTDRSRIDYTALRECLQIVAEQKTPVHMPRIGCGLAGGKWSIVEGIVSEALRDVDVTVYDLPGSGRATFHDPARGVAGRS